MRLEDLPEMQQKNLFELYNNGRKASLGLISPILYQARLCIYRTEYNLLDEDIYYQLQKVKTYRLRQ